MADIWIVLDNVQRNPRFVENRNKLVCNGEPSWLTIPVESSSRALIMGSVSAPFVMSHLNKICAWYGIETGTMQFKVVADYLSCFFTNDPEQPSSYKHTLTYGVLEALAFLDPFMEYKPKIVFASDLTQETNGGPNMLYKLFKSVEGSTYITGPSFLDYKGENSIFDQHKVNVVVDNWRPEVYPFKQVDWNYLGYLHYILEGFNIKGIINPEGSWKKLKSVGNPTQ